MSEKMIDHIVDEHNIDLDSQLLKKVKVRLKWSIESSMFLCLFLVWPLLLFLIHIHIPFLNILIFIFLNKKN
jgi:hypothetical protein